jgi:hypothetical protein
MAGRGPRATAGDAGDRVPKCEVAAREARDVRDAAVKLGIQANVLNATTENEIDVAFLALVQQKADALVIATDAFLLGQRDQLMRITRFQRSIFYATSSMPVV